MNAKQQKEKEKKEKQQDAMNNYRAAAQMFLSTKVGDEAQKAIAMKQLNSSRHSMIRLFGKNEANTHMLEISKNVANANKK